MATASITTADVSRARNELTRLRGSLKGWLKYRALNDNVLSGQGATRKSLGYAQMVIRQRRDAATEQKLANELHVLLSELEPDLTLPNADLSQNPAAAAQLAQLVLNGGTTAAKPTATNGLPSGWIWPVAIVTGLLLAATTAIRSSADVAMQKEKDACIEAGACTDYGGWLKAAAVLGLAWFVWKEMGVGAAVKAHVKKGGG